MSNYPPGCVTYRGGSTDLVACQNERCPEFGYTREIPMFWELGSYFLVNDDDGFCPECGTEMLAPGDVSKHESTCVEPGENEGDEPTTTHTEGCPVCDERKFVRLKAESGREIEFTGRGATSDDYIQRIWISRGATIIEQGHRDPWDRKDQ